MKTAMFLLMVGLSVNGLGASGCSSEPGASPDLGASVVDAAGSDMPSELGASIDAGVLVVDMSTAVEDGGADAALNVDAAGLDCVPGTQAGCVGGLRVWDGTQCCVPQGYECVDGTAEQCGLTWANGPTELWTGSRCCVDKKVQVTGGKIQCVGGTAYYCEGNYNIWTGTQCCVLDAVSCTPLVDPQHPAQECNGSNKENTGTMCCSL